MHVVHVVNLWTHFNRETSLGVGNVEDSVPGGNLILFKATVIPFHVPLCTSPKLPQPIILPKCNSSMAINDPACK